MFHGWLSYGGVEIVNDARLFEYVRNLGIPGHMCSECSTLRTAFEHDPYTTPAADNAPWYDPNIPESAQVAGFHLTSIEGLGDTSTRRVDELARHGGVVGSRRRTSRQLTVTFDAIASNECALSYAAGWLAKVLRGRDCPPVYNVFDSSNTLGCAGETLCMLTCCPTTPEDVNTYLTSLYKVGVVQGPLTGEHQSTLEEGDECGLARCSFEVTFVAGDPGWYSPAETIIDVDLADFYVGTTEPGAPYDITEECNPLLGNPDAVLCTPIIPAACEDTIVPVTQELPIPCIGVPDPRTTYTQYNYYSIPIDTSGISSWFDLVPKLFYQPGFMSPPGLDLDPQSPENFEGPVAFQIRRVTPSSPCGEQADPCDVCLELFAPVWPRATEGVADWVARKVFRLEAGGVGLCPIPVYSRGLAPFNWPTLICGDEMCLDIYIATDSDARSGHIRLDVQKRQDAQC